MPCDFALGRARAGSNRLAKIAMIAITTRSSMRVKARPRALLDGPPEQAHWSLKRILTPFRMNYRAGSFYVNNTGARNCQKTFKAHGPKVVMVSDGGAQSSSPVL